MADFEHIDYVSGEEDFDGTSENGDENEAGDENEVGIPRQRTKSETLAELRRKEVGKKHELTKIDYTSNLRKTGSKPESTPREKKTSTDSPNYLNQLKKTDTGVATQPEYVRLAKRAESGGKQVEKKYTAEELINMAFKKADDADQRDPAVRRGIVQAKSTAPSTFQGIKQTNGVKEDYKAVLKQHVSVEPKFPHKSTDDKPTWANISPRRVIQADITTRSKDNKQEKPEWAQLGRGAKKHVPEVQQGKRVEKSQTPEWASLASRTDTKRLIQLEQKKTRGKNENGQPEWAGKSRDAREILKVEHKLTRKTSENDLPDYKGMLRNGGRKE